MVFLTDLRKHNRIVKSINQTEGYLTTQVAFSYFEKGDQSLTMSEKSQWGVETWLYSSICWLGHRAWFRLEVSLHDCC